MAEFKTLDGYTLEDIVKAVLAVLQPEQEEQEELEQVSEIAVKTYKTFADYPEILQAKHLKAILGLSDRKIYEMLSSKKCPSFTAGKRRLIRKEALIKYLEACDGQDLID